MRAGKVRRGLGLGLGAVVALSGCASLLGDFTVSDTAGGDDGGPGSDGSRPKADGAVPVDGAGKDASSDATGVDSALDGGTLEASVDAALPTLTCATWKFPQPVLLDDLATHDAGNNNGNYFNGEVWVGEPTASAMRVIVQRSQGTAFTMYTYDKTTQKVSVLEGPPNTFGSAYLQTVHHFALGPFQTVTQVTVSTRVPPPATPATPGYEVYLLDDSLSPTGPLPSPIVFYQNLAQQNLQRGAFLPFDTNDVFGLLSYEDSTTPPDYTLAVGRASGSSQATLSTVATSVYSNDFQQPAMIHANGNVYAFAENSDSTLGVSAWVLPENGQLTAKPAKRDFTAGKLSIVFDLAPGAAAATTNFAYAEGELGAKTFTAVSIKVGAVPNAKLDTVTPSDLTFVRKYTDLSAAPIGGGFPEWRGDSLMMITPPGFPLPDGGVPPGANLLWTDADGEIRAEQGGPTAILRERGPINRIGAAPVTTLPAQGTWDVVWVENKGNNDQVLLYNQLQCQ